MTDETHSGDDDNRIIAERREKLAAWRRAGAAFPNDFRRDALAADLKAQYEAADEAKLAAAPAIRVAGRVMTRRLMGKASFMHLQDQSGQIQIYVKKDSIGEDSYGEFKKWDLGDIVGIRGTLFRTKTGELTVMADSAELLTKSLRPLPDKYHGLQDREARYRQRYVDLIVNPEVREVFRARARVIDGFRRQLAERGFQEVETPMMQPIPGGATARPFVTHHNALGMDLYLRVAPELYLKRLVVGGFEKVFEINRNFRNEGLSTRHNPEFTMLEFYQAYADYRDLMDLTQELLAQLAESVLGSARCEYQGEVIDFGGPYPRLTVAEAVLEYGAGELTAETLADPAALRSELVRLGVTPEPGWGWGRLLMALFENTVEDKLRQPTLITGFPTEVSPLARRNDEDPEVTDRFELIIAGREIANGFSELNDPEDQAERFRRQAAEKEAGDQEAMFYDADYIKALEYGMPPTAGEGIGIDRLVMLLTNTTSIRDVLLFPHLRPERDG